MQTVEKRAAEEKRQRIALETSLAVEKRARKEAETALKSASIVSSMTSAGGGGPSVIGSK